MKKAILCIDERYLREAIGLPDGVVLDGPPYGYHYAWDRTTFEFVITGEGLPEKYTVHEGCLLHRVAAVRHTETIVVPTKLVL